MTDKTPFEAEKERLQAEIAKPVEADKAVEVEVKAEVKPEPVEVKPEPKVDENAARQRWEAAQAKKEAEEARKEAEALRKQLEEAKKPKVEAADVEPNKAENYEAWLEWKQAAIAKEAKEAKELAAKTSQTIEEQNKKSAEVQQYNAAVEEFLTLESEFKAKTPDYEQAAKHLEKRVKDSFQTLYPSLQGKQLDQAVAAQILQWAGEYARAGQPVMESLYQLNKERFGYAPAPVEQKKEAPKVDLKAIDANKKRSATGQYAGGEGGAQDPSLESMGTMTMAQFSKLTPAQRAALKEQSRR